MEKFIYILLFYIIFFSNFISFANSSLKKPKIAIIGAHDQRYHPCGKYAHENKKRYAQKNSYDVFLYNEVLDINHGRYFNKVVAIQKHLSDYDWLFWLDSDALIMNDNIKLEHLIDENYDFITTRDCLLNINSGDFLIKNSEWSKKFLIDWLNSKGAVVDGVPADNGALLKLYKESEESRKHFKIIPLRMLSSFPACPLFYKIDGQYRKGDFIIHAAGLPTFAAKVELIKKYYIELYGVDDL